MARIRTYLLIALTVYVTFGVIEAFSISVTWVSLLPIIVGAVLLHVVIATVTRPDGIFRSPVARSEWYTRYPSPYRFFRRIARLLPSFLKRGPVYPHDCADCVFLGTTIRESSRLLGETDPWDAKRVDHYLHMGSVPSLAVRYGRTRWEVLSSTGHDHSEEPHVVIAANLAVASGHLPD